MAVLIFLPSSLSSMLDRQSHQLLWQAAAKNFSHIRFCRPNARCLSLLDDFVTTNFGRHAPVPPWSKILATPLLCASLLLSANTANDLLQLQLSDAVEGVEVSNMHSSKVAATIIALHGRDCSAVTWYVDLIRTGTDER